MSVAERPRSSAIRVLATLLAAVASMGAHAAKRSVDQKLAADPRGAVEIATLAGRVEVFGWDRDEIAVTGTLGARVERLEFTSSAGRARLRVILPKTRGGLYFGDGQANLLIHVPSGSSVSATVGSAELTVKGVAGRQQLRSISGSVHVSGKASGEMSVSTMSGSATAQVGPVARVHFKSVSGNIAIDASLAHDARIDVETMTGDVRLGLAGEPSGEFHIETLSGKIDNCFGPRAQGPAYGPGSRLEFREGPGTARVRIDTKSGDVQLCRR